jgi:hypothetical protein
VLISERERERERDDIRVGNPPHVYKCNEKKKKSQTVGTEPKSNRKRRNKDKIGTPHMHILHRLLFWLDANSSISWVRLIL